MKFSDTELPSNRRFGLFFTFVFVASAVFFYYSAHIFFSYAFISASLLFLLVTVINSDALLPLNRLWMRFGVLLGTIINPVVLGVIFFGLFVPIAMLMRLGGRDELRLKFSRKESHWTTRHESIRSESLKYQF